MNLLLGTMRDWESRNLEIKGTPNCGKRKVNLELFVPIRFGRLGNDSRRMEANVLTMMLQRIWKYMRQVFGAQEDAVD